MAEIINLPAHQGNLLLSIQDGNWSKFFLEGEQTIYLGAESLNVIASRLLEAIEGDEGPTMGEIDGQPVSYVLTLMDAHHTLYSSRQQSAIVLYFQDPNARVVAKVRLSSDEIETWRRQLAEVLSQTNKAPTAR